MSVGQQLVQRTTMSMSMNMAQRHELKQSAILTLRLELIAAMRAGPEGSGHYHPMAVCPKCERRLSPLEIIKGFSTDVNDFTTQCTGCKHRFDPKLVWRDNIGSMELPFFCDVQTQAKLKGFEILSPTEFEKQQPAIFHSAIVHNGTLKAAFAKIGIEYGFVEITDQTLKVKPFLGRLPDTIIAEVSGLKLGTIRRLRKKHNIKACTERVLLEEAQDNPS